MTDPIDPNGASPTGPAYEYRPPPPFTPPAATADQPWPMTMAPETEWAPPPPPPSHRGRNLLIVALVVLVLAACGVGAYFTSATRRRTGSRSRPPSTATPG